MLGFLGGRYKIACSLLDQFGAALSLFCFAAIVSRAVGGGVFGEFSVMLAWASLLGAVLQPLIIDSSIVLTSRAKQGDHDWIGAGVLVILSAVIFSIFCVVLLSFFAVSGYGFELLLAASSELMVSAVVLLRRASYVKGPIWMGVVISFLSLLLTVLLLPPMLHADDSSVKEVLWARFCINGLVLFLSCIVFFRSFSILTPAVVVCAAGKMLDFSRAYIGASVIFWLTNSLQVVLIGYFLSMTDAAGYRASQLLVLPLAQIQSALFQVVLPRTVQAASDVGFQLRYEIVRLTVSFGAPAFLYAAFLLWQSEFLLREIFGPSYEIFYPVVVVMGGVAVLEAVKQALVVLVYAYDCKALLMRYRFWALALFLCSVFPALWVGSLMAFVAAIGITSILLLLYLALALRSNLLAKGRLPGGRQLD